MARIIAHAGLFIPEGFGIKCSDFHVTFCYSVASGTVRSEFQYVELDKGTN